MPSALSADHDQLPASAATPAAPARPGGAVRRWFGSGFATVWLLTVALFVVSALTVPGTVDSSALQSMLPFAALLAVAAMGQTLVAQQAGLDLSSAGIISISAVTVVEVSGGSDGKLLPAILAALALGALGGLVNAVAVTRFGITPFVATLGVSALAQGTILSVTGGTMSASAPPALTDAVSDRVLGLPVLIWLTLVLVALVAWVGRRTVLGRRVELTGANPAAARAVGLPVRTITAGAYVAAGVCYGLTGVLLAGFIGRPGAFQGDPYLLSTIAAVAIGGTAFAGGRASVVATAGGALFLTQLSQVVVAAGFPPAAQNLAQGLVIAVGVGLGTRRLLPRLGSRRRRASTAA